ncbi:MAG TPA: NAD-binding protein [Candidatus Eremiobacteraceae bacterium]|nr:NAD-binding protein [Candidatus Eremiobacteraceae bacterium]
MSETLSEAAQIAPTEHAGSGLTPQEAGGTVDVIVVLGHDELGIEVCRGLARAGRRVSAVWPGREHDVEISDPLISNVFGDARRPAVLSQAGVRVAGTILAITSDDQLNLRVVLAARDLNPRIRIVLRQFNRWLGRKIVNNLDNSEAVSPETFSAATFAASCLNPSVYQAIEFPRYSEHLLTFCRADSAKLDCAGRSVGAVQAARHWQVLAIDQRAFPPDEETIPEGATVTFASLLEHAPRSAAEASTQRSLVVRPRETFWQRLIRRRYDPVLVSMYAALAGLLVFATIFFHTKLGLRMFDAFYFVITTATTTGFGDISLLHSDDMAKAVGMLVMAGGIAITGTLLAYLTATITRRSLEFARGRHPVTGRGHIVVCGFGNVGARVTQYLLHAGYRVAVIDRNPNEALADDVRALGAHVMTADATSEGAQEMTRVAHAAALLAVTDSDSANLEVALTALAYAPDLPIVMRIADPTMAKSVERHFRIRASYSAAALAAPLVTGLALGPGARGTIEIAGKLCTLTQRPRGAHVEADEIIIADDGDWELALQRP